MARIFFSLLTITMVAGSVVAVEAMTFDSHNSKSTMTFAVRAYDAQSEQRFDNWETAPILTK